MTESPKHYDPTRKEATTPLRFGRHGSYVCEACLDDHPATHYVWFPAGNEYRTCIPVALKAVGAGAYFLRIHG